MNELEQITVNERFVKISHWKKDWVPTENPMKIDQEVRLLITGQVSNVDYETNNDGTVNVIYVIKGLLAEDVKILGK